MTIFYRDGGDSYLGEMQQDGLKFWLSVGKVNKDKWLYKGYRYFDGEKQLVVVFVKTDTGRWNKEEISRRRKNGFLGIKEYGIENNKKEEIGIKKHYLKHSDRIFAECWLTWNEKEGILEFESFEEGYFDGKDVYIDNKNRPYTERGGA